MDGREKGDLDVYSQTGESCELDPVVDDDNDETNEVHA